MKAYGAPDKIMKTLCVYFERTVVTLIFSPKVPRAKNAFEPLLWSSSSSTFFWFQDPFTLENMKSKRGFYFPYEKVKQKKGIFINLLNIPIMC